MSKSTITVQELREAVHKDPDYLDMPIPIRKLLDPYLEEIPAILHDLLGTKITFRIYLEASMLCLQYSIDTEFLKLAVDTVTGDFRYWLKVFSPLLINTKKEDLRIGNVLLEDTDVFLGRTGLSEEEILFSPDETGLPQDMLEQYRVGELTIADFLLIRPLLLINPL